ncbi:O-antigen ligase family protein [Microbacterium album]|uniref:O-antigen ligase family protein n=1 Tax=Microbacterium album TaxID=2053191 RepID=UPI00166509C6|nr:O-antigen ligase family protein [Microbacterium album]
MLAGPLIALAGGRWGTYIGLPGAPIFLTDLLFAGGAALMIVSRLRGSTRAASNPPTTLYVVMAMCFGAVLMIGIASASVWSLNVVRDAVPFIYLLALPLYVAACEAIPRDRILRAAMLATSFHAVWYFAAVFKMISPVQVPGVGVDVFDTRGDFDGIVCGIAIALLLSSGRRHLLLKLAIAAMALAAMVSQGSRAGLVGGLIILAFAASARTRWAHLPQRRAGVLVATAHFAVASLIVLVSLAPALPEWAGGLQRVLVTDLSGQSSEQNTTTARFQAWGLIVDYVNASASARWFGYGFGSDVVMDSGALAYLSGNPAVRAAHSFFFTWLGFTGWVGVVLAALGLTALTLACLRRMRREMSSSLAAGTIVSIIAAGFIGVLLESPFGYLTLVFFAALSLTRPWAPAREGSVQRDRYVPGVRRMHAH